MFLIGRRKEKEELLELYNRDSADLVAVYGRRRVEKIILLMLAKLSFIVIYI